MPPYLLQPSDTGRSNRTALYSDRSNRTGPPLVVLRIHRATVCAAYWREPGNGERESCRLARVPLIALAILLVLAFIALIPVSIVLRFRAGTRRQQARGWVATLNLIAIALSTTLFLLGALVSSRWIPATLTYTLAGLGTGCVLGLLGIALTRWEYLNGRLHYTSNRWLVLAITLVVTTRVLYGFWRTWEAWRASVDVMTWVAASGLAASMSAGAVVLGYYLIYWTGVRVRIRRHRA